MKKRKLTGDERDLWRKVTRDVAPMREPAPILAERDDIIEAAQSTQRSAPKTSAKRNTTPRPKSARQATGKSTPRQDPFSAGDPKMDRHARRERLPVEAVLDLHGHTQLTAEPTLQRFLSDARQRGLKLVLVITGKGPPEGLRAQMHNWMQGRDINPSKPGVLRERFQEWMRRDDFRQHVVRVAGAHQRHGGSGAFYVFLRARRER